MYLLAFIFFLLFSLLWLIQSCGSISDPPINQKEKLSPVITWTKSSRPNNNNVSGKIHVRNWRSGRSFLTFLFPKQPAVFPPNLVYWMECWYCIPPPPKFFHHTSIFQKPFVETWRVFWGIGGGGESNCYTIWCIYWFIYLSHYILLPFSLTILQ